MTQTTELTMQELLKRLNAGQIPMTAKVIVVYEETTPSLLDKNTRAEKNPALALFEQWEQEDNQTTPEEQAENDRVYAQIEQNGITRVRI